MALLRAKDPADLIEEIRECTIMLEYADTFPDGHEFWAPAVRKRRFKLEAELHCIPIIIAAATDMMMGPSACGQNRLREVNPLDVPRMQQHRFTLFPNLGP